MKRRNLWLIVVTLLVMSLIAACGSTPTPAPEQPAEQPAEATEAPMEEEKEEPVAAPGYKAHQNFVW